MHPYSRTKKVAAFGTRKSVPVTYAGDCCIGRVHREDSGYRYMPNSHGKELGLAEVAAKTINEVKRYLNNPIEE